MVRRWRENLRSCIGNFLHRHQVSINTPPQNHPFYSKQLHSIHLSPSPISQEHPPPSLSRPSSSTNHTQYPPDSTSLSDLLVYSLESLLHDDDDSGYAESTWLHLY